jgi:hypothetical protein
MTLDLSAIHLFHITDVSNLPAILKSGGLLSDVGLVGGHHKVIGYPNIKMRRMTQIQIPCCGNRFVGEFVPFYFCARSPMLYSVNQGNTGRVPGCQAEIVHLVTTVQAALGLRRPWVFSNGNAGALHAEFFADLNELANLDWSIIQSNNWAGDIRRHRKASEFLVGDFFEWSAIREIGCQSAGAAAKISALLGNTSNPPKITVRSNWYY